MKSFLALLLFPAAASAADVSLDVPYQDATGYTFSRNGVVTGVTADGGYVLAESTGWLPHGHSGRGSTVSYSYECVQWSWDLAGYLVSETVLSNAKCPALDATLSFTNAGGYMAWTQNYPAYPWVHRPTLTTP